MTKNNAELATDLANRFWDGILKFNPLEATQLGLEEYADLDSLWDDPSEEGFAEQKSFYEDALTELARIDQSLLGEDLRITLAMLEFGARIGIREIKSGLHHVMSVWHMFGPSAILSFLPDIQRADTPERLERYIERLATFPEYLKAASALSAEAAQLGQTQPDFIVDIVVDQVQRMLATEYHESPMMGPVAEATEGAKERVIDVLEGKVWPALEDYLVVLADYRPYARAHDGIGTVPNGEEIYNTVVEANTTLPVTAEEVHEIGVAQLAVILDERQQVAEQLGFPNATAAIEAYTATGANTADSPDAILAFAEERVQLGWDAASGYFGRLPNDNCDVEPMEEIIAQSAPAAYYMTPSADGSRPGIYKVNTTKVEERLLHQLPSVAYHEGNPGHHLQISITQEHDEYLPLRRFGYYLVRSSFVEGWGLYSERLADEMGLYQNEYQRIGMLENQAWRACRLIVDTGIHAFGWTRERAIAQMLEAGVVQHEAEVEVNRYISWPGQALAYMVGQLEIEKIRRAVEEVQGADFSLSAFHDRLLAIGPSPFTTLRREMLSV